jgi:POT family proton-dependent oligopeptide transporter
MEPSTPAKIGLAMLLTAGAFGIMALAGLAGGDEAGGRVSVWYLVSAYAVVTLGELCLSPIGLSLVSKLAAKEQRSAWMGGWFAATAIGGYASGLIGQYWDTLPHSTFFFVLVCSSLGAFALLLLFYRRLVDAMPAKRPAPALPETEPLPPVPPGKGGEGIKAADAPITERRSPP